MQISQITNSYEHKPESGGKPKQLVILLHGLGADGRDLITLAPLWGRALPDAVFVSPDAPFPCDMAPMGYQWFSLQDWSHEAILQGVRRAAPILDSFITEQLEKYDLLPENLALAGFSQGTMMSLYVGPRYPEKIAGILGYSGAYIPDEGDLHNVPVHLIHGEADHVVPIAAYDQARLALQTQGFTVTGHTTKGLMHGIDEQGIVSGGEFLKSVFKA